jgi:hypothetical protein
VAEEALIEQLLAAAAGSARMAAVATEDVVGLRSHPDDWLDAWDPAYIRTTLPALRAMSKVYFRAEVRGLDNIPAEGPILLVGNHCHGQDADCPEPLGVGAQHAGGGLSRSASSANGSDEGADFQAAVLVSGPERALRQDSPSPSMPSFGYRGG